MKMKLGLILFMAFAIQTLSVQSLRAEDQVVVQAAQEAAEQEAAEQQVVVPAATPVVQAEPIAVAEPVPTPDAPVEGEAPVVSAEALEFVSGEVTTVDANANTLTLKLYGDVEDGSADKVLTISSDANTDITDGENDRTLASIEAGTEVDVEYDPAANKATYIFIY